mmetsp:Transcript_2622/g.7396  ORF Transcript_2622/g.7396 Transcript_2622/m.7396 type:complete len:342 (+) Transcript_2622:429-1454(+)
MFDRGKTNLEMEVRAVGMFDHGKTNLEREVRAQGSVVAVPARPTVLALRLLLLRIRPRRRPRRAAASGAQDLAHVGFQTLDACCRVVALELGHHQVDAQVLTLRLEEGVHELVVVDVPGAVVIVHQLEHQLQVAMVDAHDVQGVVHFRDPVALHQLVKGDRAVVVRVNLLDDVSPVLHPLKLLPLLVLGLLLLVSVPGDRGLVNDDGQDQIHEAQGHGHQGHRKDQEREVLILDDRQRALAPGVPGHERLEEKEGGVEDGCVRLHAVLVDLVPSAPHLLDHVDVERVHYLHADQGPEHQEHEDQHEAPEHGLHRSDEAPNHDVELGVEPQEADGAHQARDA